MYSLYVCAQPLHKCKHLQLRLHTKHANTHKQVTTPQLSYGWVFVSEVPTVESFQGVNCVLTDVALWWKVGWHHCWQTTVKVSLPWWWTLTPAYVRLVDWSTAVLTNSGGSAGWWNSYSSHLTITWVATHCKTKQVSWLILFLFLLIDCCQIVTFMYLNSQHIHASFIKRKWLSKTLW